MVYMGVCACVRATSFHIDCGAMPAGKQAVSAPPCQSPTNTRHKHLAEHTQKHVRHSHGPGHRSTCTYTLRSMFEVMFV